MQKIYSPLLELVIQYNGLMTRYACWLTKGDLRLADQLVKEAMEESYEEGSFKARGELREVLRGKIRHKAESVLRGREEL